MNGRHQMMPNSQICQNNVVWPLPPWPLGNVMVFPLPSAFNTYPGRVQRNTNENVHRTGSGLVHFFNGYSSMKGLIRLRTRKCGSDELSGTSGVEMVCMNSGEEQNLDKRVDKQDSHIAQLEEENLTLKERMFLMERQLGELRKRVLSFESHGREGKAENFLTEEDVCSVKSVVDGSTSSSSGDGSGGGDNNRI